MPQSAATTLTPTATVFSSPDFPRVSARQAIGLSLTVTGLPDGWRDFVTLMVAVTENPDTSDALVVVRYGDGFSSGDPEISALYSGIIPATGNLVVAFSAAQMALPAVSQGRAYWLTFTGLDGDGLVTPLGECWLDLIENGAPPADATAPDPPTVWADSAAVALIGERVTALEDAGGGAAVWGGITGTLSDQTDLQAALDLKASTGALATLDDTVLNLDTQVQVINDTVIGLAAIATSGSADDVAETATRVWFTPAQSTKLAGIATGATANSSDATLLARANHTGTQAAATITGLAAVATSGSATDLGSGTLADARHSSNIPLKNAANDYTAAGAASTPPVTVSGSIFTGGTGTTTMPQVLIRPTAATAATTWSTSGTMLGFNGPSGFVGNFIDCHVNGGASVAKIASDGSITTAGDITATGAVTLGAAQKIIFSGRGRLFSVGTDTIEVRTSTDSITASKLSTGCTLYRSGAADPTTSDIPAGGSTVWLNTTSGFMFIAANQAGTIKKSANFT